MNFQFYLFQTLSLGPDISTLTGAHLWPEDMLTTGSALLSSDVAVTAAGGVLQHCDHGTLLTRDIIIIIIMHHHHHHHHYHHSPCHTCPG